jgi:plasmid stabilization system protein ParE
MCLRFVKRSNPSDGSIAYRVEITRRALRDLTGIYSRIEADTRAQAARWLDGMEKAIS